MKLTNTYRMLLVPALALGVVACRSDEKATKDRLDKMIAQAEDLEKKLDRAGQQRPGAAAAGNQPGRPDPTAVYSVPVEGNPTHGPATAKVTIVEAFEYACPFCLRVNPTIEELRKQYGDNLRVVYKNYVVHPQVATAPALATCAAQRQNKYHEFSKTIWEKSWENGRIKDLSEDTMLGYAKDLGLNVDKFKSDMSGEACKTQIANDQKQLAAVGTRGTPAFYINGRFLSGAQPIDKFKAVIDEELKKADEALKAGKVAEGDYYSSIVKSGKKSL
jgi:protein-disulfide isomerase